MQHKGRPLQFMLLPTEMLEGMQCSIALSFLFVTGDIISMPHLFDAGSAEGQ